MPFAEIALACSAVPLRTDTAACRYAPARAIIRGLSMACRYAPFGPRFVGTLVPTGGTLPLRTDFNS